MHLAGAHMLAFLHGHKDTRCSGLIEKKVFRHCVSFSISRLLLVTAALSSVAVLMILIKASAAAPVA